MTGTAVKKFTKFEAELAVFEQRYKGVVYDFSVKKNEKQARSDRYAIAKAISALDAAHKQLKEPILAKTKILDGARKEIKDGLLSIQTDIKNQIEKHEQIEKDRVGKIQERIARIKSSPEKAETLGAADIRDVMEAVQGIKIDDSFAEFQQEALFTKMDAAMALQPMYEKRLAFETEQAEHAEAIRLQEEKARKEREEGIRRQAQLDAEEASKNQIAAAEAAKKEAEEAAAKAIKDAEDRAEQAERDAKKTAAAAKLHEERLEKQKRLDEEAAEERRVADKEHRIKIECGVIDGLINAGLELMDAKVVIDAIGRNEVPNLTINY